MIIDNNKIHIAYRNIPVFKILREYKSGQYGALYTGKAREGFKETISSYESPIDLDYIEWISSLKNTYYTIEKGYSSYSNLPFTKINFDKVYNLDNQNNNKGVGIFEFFIPKDTKYLIGSQLILIISEVLILRSNENLAY